MKRTCLHCKQRKRDPGSRADTAWDMYYFCVEFIPALIAHLYLAISGVGRAQICPSSDSLQYSRRSVYLERGPHFVCASQLCVYLRSLYRACDVTRTHDIVVQSVVQV